MTGREQRPTIGPKARVLIVDDHPVVREGLAVRINQQPDLLVCAEADSSTSAVSQIGKSSPDVAVTELTLREGNGLELIKDLARRRPKLPVLVLSVHDERVFARRALLAGARGYIMKDQPTENVVSAIRRVLAGQIYLSDQMGFRLLNAMLGGEDRLRARCDELLTDRELEVFGLLGLGLGSRQIANKLHLSIKTIETYYERIKQKLHLESMNELVRDAVLWSNRPREA